MAKVRGFTIAQVNSLASGNNVTKAQAAAWTRLFGTLTDLVNAFTQTNVTFGDNIPGTFESQSITTQPGYFSGTFHPIVLPWKFTNPPKSCVVAQVIVPSNQQDRLLSAVTCQCWTYDAKNGVVRIPYVTGLHSNSNYTITFKLE